MAMMIDNLLGVKALGSYRGMLGVDRYVLIAAITTPGHIAMQHNEVMAININPLIVTGAQSVIVDAAVLLRAP